LQQSIRITEGDEGMTSTLNLHAGGRDVTREELALIKAPQGTETWFPIHHAEVLTTATRTLKDAGFEITRERLSVAKGGDRFFGTLDLTAPIVEGITLAVGIRNSCDKSCPIGFCAGSRVFVCSNLAFTSEVVVSKRHTRNGQNRYVEGLSRAVASLGQYQATQAEWIGGLRSRNLAREEADSIILRSFEDDLIGARQLPLLIEEWRNPQHEEFREQSAWSLWNAFTAVLGRTTQAKQPAQAALMTIRLQGLFKPKEVIDVEYSKIEERSVATAS
jgi:uncharacterized protein DUF932